MRASRRRPVRIAAVAAVVLVLVLVLAPLLASPPSSAQEPGIDGIADGFERRVERIGTSVEGRPIVVTSRGRRSADVDVLVVGVIHGSERAGLPVVRELGRVLPPRRVRYWLLPTLDVDGARRGTRQNARGVDLNRNFPREWRGGGRPFDTYFPGRRAASEPETRALTALVGRIRPDVTIWYHQHANLVIEPPARWRRSIAVAYQRGSGLAVRRSPFGRLYGTATAWQHHVLPRSAALVVELPAGRLEPAAVTRHAEGVRRAALAAAFDDVRSP